MESRFIRSRCVMTTPIRRLGPLHARRALRTGSLLLRREPLDQPIDESDLSGIDLLARGRDVEELAAIDLGELVHAARSRRPLEREAIALEAHALGPIARERPG